MLEKPLGKFIQNQILLMEKEIEHYLTEIDKKIEWVVLVDYNFTTNQEKRIQDSFLVTVYLFENDVRKGKFTFKFNSLESIFLKEICETIFQVTQKPSEAEKILANTKCNIVMVDFNIKVN